MPVDTKNINAMLPEKVPGGAFGMFILAAINRLNEDAYGAKIAKLLVEHGRSAPTPRVYQNLAQLEEAGLLTSQTHTGDGPRVRGKPARVYSLTDSAKSIIQFFLADTSKAT
ncbi:helix-turn-helix transcriptional regulator [Cognatiyoonia sp. IB215446]|uniref:PadR family transcriptional regulator n=1 Tax=Cognatiyoonia sp. IB215446 TaxID=3097355 RepID=UPI002A0DEF19|nr:helix-turn-helix transcriptional regulator [Cognatiyoonia sp. IB215446]MDX8346517.1 helix-turn-helix transcriptional regulator [Cognatiyoonia sp. IB215446]